MAGGYLESNPMPSSRRSSLADSSGAGNKSPSDSRTFQLPILPAIGLRTDSLGLLDPLDESWNERIPKSPKGVKWNVRDFELQQDIRRGSASGPSIDRRGLRAQAPLSTTNIPAEVKLSDARVQSPPQAHLPDRSSNASAAVMGPLVHSPDISPGTSPSNEIRELNETPDSALNGALQVNFPPSPSLKPPKSSPLLDSPITTAAFSAKACWSLDNSDANRDPDISNRQIQNESDDQHEERRPVDNGSTRRSSAARRLMRQMTRQEFNFFPRVRVPSPGLRSGQTTPVEETYYEDYVERPAHYRGGILSSLLKLYGQPGGATYTESRRHSHQCSGRKCCGHSRHGSASDASGRGSSPDLSWCPHRRRKWHERSPNWSSVSLTGSTRKNSACSTTSGLKRSKSIGAIAGIAKRWAMPQADDEFLLTVHITDVLSRQRYLILLCDALMRYGAPTHRLEEAMKMTARVLQIDAQFLYIPGCMIVSFDDSATHTTEVKLLRSPHGLDLGKMADVHEVYKEVIHGVLLVNEAIPRLEEIRKRRNKFPVWFQILIHGCAAATVGPFAFSARPIDMPIAFVLGMLLGVLQLVLSPRSQLYSNVFEISAAVLTSFLSRAFGSIPYKGGRLFCFSALAQSSIALILPGYTVVCASLELQSRSIVAGSVRIVYAIIYSLFLGFGITIGTAVYGLLDANATSEFTCPPNPIQNPYLSHFPFVLAFTACLGLVNHAKWRQIPVMLVISCGGYATNYFSWKRLQGNAQVADALGAFVIGVLGNLYSRLRHGLAAAAMLPAIWVLVPSGLAASGALVSGIAAADGITSSPYTIITNGTQGFVDAAKNMTRGPLQSTGVAFDIGYGMVQVAIAFTVGLFLAALVVYPLGKRRSGLFSF